MTAKSDTPKPSTEPAEPAVEAPAGEPGETGYCRNADCPQVGVKVHLFRPVSVVPVLCQCGQLLHDEPHDPPADETTDAGLDPA